MRRYQLFVFLVVLGVSVQMGCQQQAREATEMRESAGAAPEITFEKTVYDFGEVSSGKEYTGQFKFTNTGSGNLKITDVKKCCGAVVMLDKKELAPGESATLKVGYYAGRIPGPMLRQLRVFSNDATNPKVTLDIKAQVVMRIDYQPERIDLLRNKEGIDCPKITIRSLDNQPFSITAFQSTGETLTASIDPGVEATEFVLEPKVDLQKHRKNPRGLVAISLTHPEIDKVTVRFITKERFELKPTSIFLLHLSPQEPSINKVFVVSNYGEQFEIESTTSEKGLVKLLSQQKVTMGYQLEVEIVPPPRDETNVFNDVLHLHLNNGEDLSLKCYGRYADLKK